MKTISGLLDRLELERLDLNLFRGTTPNDGRSRIFGGLVAAQTLRAAYLTVEDRQAHSIHGYFLREGDPTVPVIYEVDRIRDGRSFVTRRVRAIQHGEAIFNSAISFQKHEEGLEHQIPMPQTPPPETIPSNEERLQTLYDETKSPLFDFLLKTDRPLEHRDVDYVDVLKPKARKGMHRLWFRARGEMPEDPCLHQCALAYASDIGLLDNSINYHGYTVVSPELMIASLDHAIWFHRPFRADQWLLYVMESPVAYGGRGLNWGHVYTQDGVLVASVTQECLMRIRDAGKQDKPLLPGM